MVIIGQLAPMLKLSDCKEFYVEFPIKTSGLRSSEPTNMVKINVCLYDIVDVVWNQRYL